MAPRKAAFVIFSFLLVSLFFITTRHEDIKELASSFQEEEKEGTPCKEDLSWLDTYEFSTPIHYASRRISINYVAQTDPGSVTLLETPLFPDLQELNLTKDSHRSSECDEPITLDVLPPPETANASHIIFGIQTTIQRLSDTIIHLARWLPNTGAHIYVIVIESEGVPAPAKLMKSVESDLRAQGILATLVHPEQETDSFSQRYFSLINVMHSHRTPETEWVVLLDDDTFFPSMPALLSTLNRFDSSVPQYLGSLSEDWKAIDMHGFMGFGGAGIFLSTPLASIMTEPKTYASCKDVTTSAGDIATMDCIYRNTPYKVTLIPSLHQMDIFGDISGFLESGRPMLSLHHWKVEPSLPIEKMHLISDFCDAADCFLRRWQFEDKFVLTNGFSVNQYPEGKTVKKETATSWFQWNKPDEDEEDESRIQSYVAPLNLQEVERTWNDNDKIKMSHSLEPTRPGLEVGKEKIPHRLIDAVKVGDEIRQVYFRSAGDEGELDTVLVLYWKIGMGEEAQELEKALALSE